MPKSKRVAGKPFKRGTVYWSRINGVRTSLGTSNGAEALAYVDKLNHEGFLVGKLDVAPKRSWQEAVVQRKAEMEGLADWENQRRYLLFWDKFLGKVDDLNKITRDMIHKIMLAERGERAENTPEKRKGLMPGKPCSGNSTANKYVKAVQTILNQAEKEWQWQGVRAAKLMFYPEPTGRKVALTGKEVRKRIEKLPPHSRDIALYAAATMQRRANITGLRWEWIDFEHNQLFIPGEFMKNGEDFCVPLNAMAMAILKRRALDVKRHPELVFHWRGERIKQVVTRTWREVQREHGTEKVLLHTMRHSGASWLVGRGVNEATIAWLGGWKLPTHLGAMKRYLHAHVDKLRPVAALLDEELVQGAAELSAERQQRLGVVTQVAQPCDQRAVNDTVLSQRAVERIAKAA
jgi:integrase